MNYTYKYASPIGDIALFSDGNTLTGLFFDDERDIFQKMFKNAQIKKLAIFEESCEWLDIYFRGQPPQFTPTLQMVTSDFRKAVWKIMLEIPFGKTTTYKKIAEKIAQQRCLAKMSAQAVGQAVGHNAISLIIPCHRVVGSNNSLTGYSAGLSKKVYLLQMEGLEIVQSGTNLKNNKIYYANV